LDLLELSCRGAGCGFDGFHGCLVGYGLSKWICNLANGLHDKAAVGVLNPQMRPFIRAAFSRLDGCCKCSAAAEVLTVGAEVSGSNYSERAGLGGHGSLVVIYYTTIHQKGRLSPPLYQFFNCFSF
jgi:hypothetical protein